ncbi:Interferon-induced gtp-binding protein mx [Globisporangium polare]
MSISDTQEKKTKSQSEVQVGDLIEVFAQDKWQKTEVVECKPHGLCCSLFPDEWLGATRWRYVCGTSQQDELQRFIAENRGDELAIFPSYRVFCNLFRRTVDQWRAPTLNLLRHYREQIAVVSNALVGELHTVARVEHFIKSVSSKVLTLLSEDAERALMALLKDEYRPYTQDARLFHEVDNRRQQAFRAQLDALYPNMSVARAVGEVFSKVTQLLTLSAEREARDMEITLQVYAEFAARRFVDIIPMRLHDHMLVQFQQMMEDELTSVTDEKLASLLQDSPAKAEKRELLMRELECLMSAKEEIEMLSG